MLTPFPLFPGAEPPEPSKPQEPPAQAQISIAMLIKPRRPARCDPDETATNRPATPPRH